jgi:hypothetical protein
VVSLSFMLSHQNFVHSTFLSHVCHLPHAPHFP